MKLLSLNQLIPESLLKSFILFFQFNVQIKIHWILGYQNISKHKKLKIKNYLFKWLPFLGGPKYLVLSQAYVGGMINAYRSI